ncbi:hypothetical protein BIW11_13038 [Tropilaelaps mercedesae]|uniref:Uncharacterized protein n=1 Tax=Tropilaelaps mercedesae TaxID=418985 RepID=A0A1V9X4N8_9ACAR|nr:hypothetical protein BIW11_13038 [Tropilaelaps mercedesae]
MTTNFADSRGRAANAARPHPHAASDKTVVGVTSATTVADLLAILRRSQMLSPASAFPASSLADFEGGIYAAQGPRRRDCLVVNRGGMEHLLGPTDRPLRLLAHSGGHLIYKPDLRDSFGHVPPRGGRLTKVASFSRSHAATRSGIVAASRHAPELVSWTAIGFLESHGRAPLKVDIGRGSQYVYSYGRAELLPSAQQQPGQLRTLEADLF